MSQRSENIPQPTGLVYLFTGDGKGKTSAALGTAVRAFARGWTIQWVAFYKEASWGISEYQLPEYFKQTDAKRFKIHALGKGFFIRTPDLELHAGAKTVKSAKVNSARVVDTATPDEHTAAAQAALKTAVKLLQKQPEVLVLDEICNAVDDGLIPLAELLDLLHNRGATHVVLTGRSAGPELIEHADLVSRIENVKHPYDAGKLAVAGLDY